ncbi:uncharacterized protein LOC135494975 isoform X2 [Lineus longissimus]|uniref:uncharacterized protein LOC135494975 isoform X2 n=1 Tax=Lineus longissimus TaxID=88925 RepID=UPI002B4ED908
MQRYMMGVGKMTKKGEVGLMDFSSEMEDDKSGFASDIPAAARTNQSLDDQFSETESHEEVLNRPNSLSHHVQVPGQMADVSFSPAATATGGSNGSGRRVNNNSMESSIQSDVIRVDITDLDGNESINLTTTTLKRCKEEVLRPYWRLLMFIAWRGFGRESINPSKWYWRVINIIYFILLIILLMYSYIYEILACEWRLNVHEDVLEPTLPTTTPQTTTPNTTANATTMIIPWVNLYDASKEPVTWNGTLLKPAMKLVCEHVITTYVIPNILHFIAYIIGFIYFRVLENEQLYALMEKVFLQASPLQGRMVSQTYMIKKLQLFLGLGAAWVILTIALQVIYVLAFGISDIKARMIPESQFWIMFGFQILGILLTSSISLAVVVNYGSQCEILIFFINGIQLRIQEKTGDLKSMMKDILAVRQSLGQLNGAMSRMTSLMAITFAEMVVIGITILIINKYNTTMIWVYRSLFPCVWLIILLFPLIQAARTNSACAKFKRIALETRVFGYQNSSLLELDSFLLFVSNTRLKAKLFHLPVRSSFLIGFTVITCFIILILMQVNVIYTGENSLW